MVKFWNEDSRITGKNVVFLRLLIKGNSPFCNTLAAILL